MASKLRCVECDGGIGVRSIVIMDIKFIFCRKCTINLVYKLLNLKE